MTHPQHTQPAHVRIAQAIRNDIESGRLRDGQRLPTTRDMAQQWQASQRTITLAMEQLTAEGYIATKDRSGRVVTTPLALTSAMASPIRPARPRIVYVGGYPGSGKSEFGRTLARETGWAFIDKDTLSRPIIEPALEDLGSTFDDRDSEIYVNRIRPREYDALAAVIQENVECGNSVVAAAPYLREFNDRTWIDKAQAIATNHGADSTFVWVKCSVDTMLMYLRKRGAARDNFKLSRWEEWSKGIDLSFRPATEHLVVENDPGNESLRTQALRMIEMFRRDPVSASQ
ncbi:AAA family ATPase [Nocardia jiangxiensis]|uniref:AAA family ATPase n=1 Tax=Nocardia jiangxiensis TaxID=282685 RepID=UPI00030E84EC|nr:AAA family ATPase [Nocardia jiangxiensis]